LFSSTSSLRSHYFLFLAVSGVPARLGPFRIHSKDEASSHLPRTICPQ
jgi:hypothetical protein